MKQKFFDTGVFVTAAKGGIKIGLLPAIGACITGSTNPVELALASSISTGTIMGTFYAIGLHNSHVGCPDNLPKLVFLECVMCIGLTQFLLKRRGSAAPFLTFLLDLVIGSATAYGIISAGRKCWPRSFFNAPLDYLVMGSAYTDYNKPNQKQSPDIETSDSLQM